MIDEAKRDRICERVREEPAIMAILNTTPDSFYDGGAHNAAQAALDQAGQFETEGADILDVGGESTRPGAERVSLKEELDRVIGIITAFSAVSDLPISIDTYKAEVARQAVRAGAVIINDVTCGAGDPQMLNAVRDTEAIYVATYNRGTTVEALDVTADMLAFFELFFKTASEIGIEHGRIWLDPGFGFSKTPAQNFQLIRDLASLKRFGSPVLVGASRKSSLGLATGRAVEDRLAATLATHLLACDQGADILRVHDVAAHRDALNIHAAIQKGFRC